MLVCRLFVRALVCTGLLNLARDDQLPGEPAPLPRRVGHARHSDGLYPTQLGTTPQAHEVSCAHLLMCHGAAGCFQRCIGHGRRHFRGRCLPTPRREQILLTAIHTSSTRRINPYYAEVLENLRQRFQQVAIFYISNLEPRISQIHGDCPAQARRGRASKKGAMLGGVFYIVGFLHTCVIYACI